MRLAWFSPLPPQRTGVAAVSADLIRALGREHDIELFVDEPAAGIVEGARSAHDFVWRHRQRPYDVAVYQLGNSSHHDYIWPYLFRYPGLAVLHDAHLHHARAACLLRQGRARDYRAEFAACEREVSADAAELAVAGFDSHLLYAWPFTRLVVSASRVTAVHSRLVRDRLQAESPASLVEHIRLGHGVPLGAGELAERRLRARRKYGIRDDDVVFGVFGGLTPEKRIPEILDAFGATLRRAPWARLLLMGAPADHYDVAADIRRRPFEGRVALAGYAETEEDLTDGIAASDVTLNLRWPTAREMSGPWLRGLAAAKPSIITDLAHLANVPALDPRTWTCHTEGGSPPVAVAVDILDEGHSLRLAMRRLSTDALLRQTLGAAARAYWDAEHAPAAMLDDYRRILPRAAETAAPLPSLPGHLRDDGSGVLKGLLDGMGVLVPWGKI